MPRSVAFCWELGAGFGHFSKLSPFVDFFQRNGFHVSLIARDVWSSARWFDPERLKLFQAPFRHGSGMQFSSTPTFAHILYNVGFSDPQGLFALASSWRSLLELIRPDLIVADHSPTAILAARGLSIPTLICGSGFGCPPDESPMADLMPWLKSDPMQLVSTETTVLDSMNSVLAKWGLPALNRVSQLYHDGPKKILLTFEELDHFPNRKGERHWGYWPFQPGQKVSWPPGSGAKIFAYLKRSPHIQSLLNMLSQKPFRTLAYLGADCQDLKRQFRSSPLQICDAMIDLADAGRSADLAITNGNLGTTTAMLLSGVPVLSIPLHLEQLLIGKAVERMGAGAAVPPENLPVAEKALHAMLSQTRYQESAKAFAKRHQDFSFDRHRQQIEAEISAQLQSID